MRSGWKTWQKYAHLFPSATLYSGNPKERPGSTSIFIINKNRFNDVVNKNKKDFEEVLCREIVDGFELIREAESCSLMNEVLAGHQALMGMVLGYGRENAWQFHEGCKTRTPIGWVWGEEKEFFGEEPIASESTLPGYYLSLYSCPSFAGDPHSAESSELKREYLATKQKVLKYYRDKDFLEATLSLLAGYNPRNME